MVSFSSIHPELRELTGLWETQSTPLVGTLPPPNALQKKVQALGKKLKRRQITGSQNVALEVVRLLRDLVAANKLANFELLLAYIELIGKELQTDGPKGDYSKSIVQNYR